MTKLKNFIFCKIAGRMTPTLLRSLRRNFFVLIIFSTDDFLYCGRYIVATISHPVTAYYQGIRNHTDVHTVSLG